MLLRKLLKHRGMGNPIFYPLQEYSYIQKTLNKYCDFISENDKNLILGKNLKTLLTERGKID